MASIFFVDDPARLRLDLPGPVLCLHHQDYAPVQLPDGATVMLWSEFYDRYKAEPGLIKVDNVVFVGTNHIITPSNRTDPVFETLFSGTREINKVSVDLCPFVSVPWRTWFHFGIVNRPYGRYDYSYACETDWNKAQDGLSDYDPFDLDEMLHWSKLDGAVVVTRGDYFTDLQVITVDLLPDVVAEYQDLRDALLDTEKSVTPVLRKLAAFAREHCRQRHIPQPHAFFRKPEGVQIVRTNLGIDDYLTEQLLGLAQLTNNYLEAMRE